MPAIIAWVGSLSERSLDVNRLPEVANGPPKGARDAAGSEPGVAAEIENRSNPGVAKNDLRLIERFGMVPSVRSFGRAEGVELRRGTFRAPWMVAGLDRVPTKELLWECCPDGLSLI